MHLRGKAMVLEAILPTDQTVILSHVDSFNAQERVPLVTKRDPNVFLDLHPWVRDKFLELWHLAQTPDPF